MNPANSSNLIKELKGAKFLPLYNQDLVEEVIKDTNDMKQSMQQLVKEINNINTMDNTEELNEEEQEELQKKNEKLRKESTPYMVSLNSMIHRNKRNLLVYTNYRLEKIEEAFWQYGSVIPQDILTYISESEKQYVQNYKNLLQEYESTLPLDLELTQDIEPPNSMNIEVRVVEDCGEILTREGETLNLEKNTFHYVQRQDVEHLILQGKLMPTGF